jgi:pimeloyl-ACP methyl ester carboxylesterase
LVVIICGKDGLGCGGEGEPLHDVVVWALQNGYDYKTFDYDDCVKIDKDRAKLACANLAVDYIRGYDPDNLYIIGHSAGADIAILVVDELGYDKQLIRKVTLLDPSLDATLEGDTPGVTSTNLTTMLEKITQSGIITVLVDAGLDNPMLATQDEKGIWTPIVNVTIYQPYPALGHMNIAYNVEVILKALNATP